MNSLILRTVDRLVGSLLLMASLFLLWRGHNEPGGGFSGGLMAASAFVLHAIAAGPEAGRQALKIPPTLLIPLGLAVALLAALIAFAAGEPFFTGQWVTLNIPGGSDVKLGTPLLFDVGVYLVVVGITLTIILSLMEEE